MLFLIWFHDPLPNDRRFALCYRQDLSTRFSPLTIVYDVSVYSYADHADGMDYVG